MLQRQMGRRISTLLAAAVCLQVFTASVSHVTAAGDDLAQQPLTVAFAFTGVSKDKADSATLRDVIAKVAGVPPAAVIGCQVSEASAAGDSASPALQASATISTVNLAAPYGRLTAESAAPDLAAALKSALGATYGPQSLQVDAPAWVLAAIRPPATTETVTVRFITTGLALPSMNEFRLRAVVGTVAGVRLEAVQIRSLEYAVAAMGRRAGPDGYNTLQVSASVDADSAAAAGNKLSQPSAAAMLADQLHLVLGAAYKDGSLQVVTPADRKRKAINDKAKVELALIIAAAVLLALTLMSLAAYAVYLRRAKAAAALPAGKVMQEDAALFSSPAFTPEQVAGAKTRSRDLPAPSPLSPSAFEEA